MTDRVYVPPTDDQLVEYVAEAIFGPDYKVWAREAVASLLRNDPVFHRTMRGRHRAAQEAAWALEEANDE